MLCIFVKAMTKGGKDADLDQSGEHADADLEEPEESSCPEDVDGGSDAGDDSQVEADQDQAAAQTRATVVGPKAEPAPKGKAQAKAKTKAKSKSTAKAKPKPKASAPKVKAKPKSQPKGRASKRDAAEVDAKQTSVTEALTAKRSRKA